MNFDREGVLSRFQELREALIDASSIIYIYKAGFYNELKDSLKLYSLKEIVRETGFDDLKINLIEALSKPLSNDQKFIACALKKKIPVISEDRKILMYMKRANIPYFNALMMLHFLLFKRKIDPENHTACLKRLMSTARYSPSVHTFGKGVYEAVVEYLEK